MEQKKSYYERNRKRQIEKQKRWNDKNKEKLKRYQKRYQRSNKEQINEYNKKHNKDVYHKDENKRKKVILMSDHVQFLNGRNNNISTLVGMSLDEYKNYISSLLPDDLSWENYGKKWQIRRKIGYKNFDLSNPEERKKFMSYENVKITRININE